MKLPADSLAVTKVVQRGSDLVCLLNGVDDDRQSAIKSVTFFESFSRQENLLTFGVFITDVTVSSEGTVWLVDILGNLHEVNFVVDGELRSKVSSYRCYSLDEHIKNSEVVTPVCIVGGNDNLWIASAEGLLVHYDGSCFTTRIGVKNPAKLKDINGRCFLLGYAGEVMEIIDGQLENVLIGESGIINTPISDLTMCNGNIIAVSRLGYILISVDGSPFTVLHSSSDISWYGCDTLNGVVYLAGGQHGAYALSKGELIHIKEKGFMVSVVAAGDAITYICNENNKRGFVRYTPLDGDEWVLVKAGS